MSEQTSDLLALPAFVKRDIWSCTDIATLARGLRVCKSLNAELDHRFVWRILVRESCRTSRVLLLLLTVLGCACSLIK